MTITGIAAGVPYVALPPADHDPSKPLVLAWHLLDPPRNERSFAAALPLAGLDAWRIYFGLPLTGARLPAGGHEGLMALGFEDAPVNLFGPITAQAVAETPAALAAVRSQLGLADDVPIGLLGGSQGAAVALDVLASGTLDAVVATIASPLTQLRPLVLALIEFYGMTYDWSPAADAVAARLDYAPRAAEVAARCPAVQIITGALDREAIVAPAAALATALRIAGVEVEEQLVDGMAHELAEPPGDDPAPQTAAAATVDALAVAWLARHLRP